MSDQQVFQDTFEGYAPEALQVAYDFSDAHEDVRRVWVIAILGKAMSASAVYDVNGHLLGPHELDQQIAGLDCSPQAQANGLLVPLVELTDEFENTLREAGVEVPTRVVVRYDVQEEEMEASMTYDDLQAGVSQDDRVDAGSLIDQWVERLRATGDDSAEA